MLELLDGANAGTLDAVLGSATAFTEWLSLPAAVRGPCFPVGHGTWSGSPACRVQSADAEALLLAVKLVDRLSPNAMARCELLPSAGSSAFFSKQHLDTLLPALLSSTAAHPRIHSVWEALVERLSREKRGAVETCWEVACENSLFSSSHERKCVPAAAGVVPCSRAHRSCNRFLGFKLFSMLLPLLHGHDVAALFSQNFMRCLVNSLTNEDTLLHASASLCLTNVREALFVHGSKRCF